MQITVDGKSIDIISTNLVTNKENIKLKVQAEVQKQENKGNENKLLNFLPSFF